MAEPSRPVYDPDAPALVLSPHLHAAPLNTWAILTGSWPLHVVNVFAGLPRPRTLTEWDELNGADDSAEFALDQIEADRFALAIAGRTPIDLPFRPQTYRERDELMPELNEISAEIVKHVRAVGRIYAPAGIGGAIDHRVTREYALMLQQIEGIPLTLYAELPYSIREGGWPVWLTGRQTVRDQEEPEHHFWSRYLRQVPGLNILRATVVELADEGRREKLVAMRPFMEQLALVARADRNWAWDYGLLADPHVRGTEIYWRIS